LESLVLIVLIAAVACLAGCTKKVQVPDVKGLTTDKASQALTAAQLKVGKTSCGQGDVLPGAKIVAQSPSSGQAVPVNSLVDLVVEDSIAVPKVVDSGAADALIAIQNAGLKAALKKQTSLAHWGTVVQQDIPPNTMVGRDTIVTVTVAVPPDVSMLEGLITSQPAYQRLSEKQRSLLSQLFK
jgi:beta-lactam-binding protein with PASTA domain